MEGVPSLVQQRAHVAGDAGGVHEDEWPLARREAGAEPARPLARAAFEIEQPLVDHRPELGAEDRVDLGEDRPGASGELANAVVGLQRRPAQRILPGVPRSQRVDAHLLLAPFQPATDRRHDGLLDGVVPRATVVGGVAVAVLGLEDVIEIRLVAGVAGGLLSQPELGVEDVRQRLALLDVGLELEPECLLAHVGVLVEQVLRQPRDGNLLTLPVDRHAAGDLAVGRVVALQLALQRHVLLAEEIPIRAHFSQRHVKIVAGVAGVEQLVGETDRRLVALRSDVLREPQERRFLLGVGRVDGVGDVGAGTRLHQRGFERGPLGQPRFDPGRVIGVERSLGEGGVPGGDIVPRGVGEGGGGGWGLDHEVLLLARRGAARSVSRSPWYGIGVSGPASAPSNPRRSRGRPAGSARGDRRRSGRSRTARRSRRRLRCGWRR